MARKTLVVYSAATSLLALSMIIKLPGISTVVGPQEREAALGFGPNIIAMLMALAVVAIIGLHQMGTFRGFISKTLTVIVLLLLLAAIARTGARTGLIALMLGFSVYLLPYRHSGRKFVAGILALLGMAMLVYFVVNNPIFMERWEQTVYEGKTSGRLEITIAGLQMILEKPLFGWKPFEYWLELGTRIGINKYRDTHNLFLHLLIEVGISGAVPFFIGLWMCGSAAWRARKGSLGLIPLALFVTIVAANMGDLGIMWKQFWLVLAISLAAAPVYDQRLRRSIAVSNSQHQRHGLRRKTDGVN